MPQSDPPAKPRKCPICKSMTTDEDYSPFCSRRCADIDLGRWLTGGYAIAGDTNDDAADEARPAPVSDDDFTDD